MHLLKELRRYLKKQLMYNQVAMGGMQGGGHFVPTTARYYLTHMCRWLWGTSTTFCEVSPVLPEDQEPNPMNVVFSRHPHSAILLLSCCCLSVLSSCLLSILSLSDPIPACTF